MSNISNYILTELLDEGRGKNQLRVVKAVVTHEPELKIRIVEDSVLPIEYGTEDKLKESILPVLRQNLDGHIFRSNGGLDGPIATAIMRIFKEFYQKGNSPVSFLGYTGLPDLILWELLLREVIADTSIEIADNLILLKDIEQELELSINPLSRDRLNYIRAVYMLKHEIRTGFNDDEILLLSK